MSSDAPPTLTNMSAASAAAAAGQGQPAFTGHGSAAPAAIPDALLERMMDRKLRMLDLEYEECIKSTKGYNIEDYDQGPTGDEEGEAGAAAGVAASSSSNARPAKIPDAATDPEAARAYGYAPFGGDSAAASSLPVDDAAPADDEWSEAWADYKRECLEEEQEAAARGITDSDVAAQTTQPEQPLPPKPLTNVAVDKIKGVMAGIKLKPPIWALNVPEEVWMAQILARAGVRPAGAASAAPAAANGSTAAASAAAAAAALDKQKADERKKRAKQKKKRAAKAAAAAAAAAAADFETDFPAAAAAAPNATPAAADAPPSTAASQQQSNNAALQTPD